MVNLLPSTNQKKLRIRYFAKLATASLFLFTSVAVVGAALLVPAYVLSKNEVVATERYLDAAKKNPTLQASGSLHEVAILKERISILNEYQGMATAGQVLARIEADVPPGVTLSGTSLTFTGKNTGTVSISGKASTRTALLSFEKTLTAERIFQGVAVPVGDLANDTNINFSLPFSFSITTP